MTSKTIKPKTPQFVLTTAQLERGSQAWKAFNNTSAAFATYTEKSRIEADQAKTYLAAFVQDAGGSEELGLKMALQAFKDKAPKKLTAAQIAMIPIDESIEDAEAKNAARIRKVVERFKSLMINGKKQTESDKKAQAKRNDKTTKALSATTQSSSEIPFAVKDANYIADNSPVDLVRTVTIENAIKSVFVTISHELKVLQIAKRPIEYDCVAMRYCLALAVEGHLMSKGEVMPSDVETRMASIRVKHNR